MFWKGFSLIFAPLALLLTPLLFHHSPEPRFGSWSSAYALGLAIAWGTAIAVSLGLAFASRSRQSLFPSIYTLFVVGMCVVTFAIAEFALTLTLRSEDSFEGFRSWGHERSMIFGFEAAPDNEWAAADANYSTDARGFRTHVSKPDWESSEGPRIFTLGGSSTFGYGLDDDATWPHRLEELLRAQPGHEGVTVINAGNNGFNSLQNLLKYYLRVAPRSPSHLVYYGGFNDIWPTALEHDAIWMHPDILFRSSVVDYWAGRTEGQNLYVRSLVSYTISRSLGLELAAPATDDADADADADDGPAATHDRKMVPKILQDLPREEADIIIANAELFRRNLRTLSQVAKAEGVQLIFTTIIHANPPLSSRGRAVGWHNRVLRDVAKSEGLQLIDIEVAFRRADDKPGHFQKDRYHPAAGAAEFIASEIARGLEDEPLTARASTR